MYRPESLIIDNNKLKLSEELNKILQGQKTFDVSTAYFNISGFQLIKDSILGVEKFRLLLGVSPQKEIERPDIFEPEQVYNKGIRQDLEDEANPNKMKEILKENKKIRRLNKANNEKGIVVTKEEKYKAYF